LTPEEVNTLLDITKNTRQHTPVILGLTTGMRRGEVLAIRWKDISLDKATIP